LVEKAQKDRFDVFKYKIRELCCLWDGGLGVFIRNIMHHLAQIGAFAIGGTTVIAESRSSHPIVN
jgi:hypothetical protein